MTDTRHLIHLSQQDGLLGEQAKCCALEKRRHWHAAGDSPYSRPSMGMSTRYSPVVNASGKRHFVDGEDEKGERTRWANAAATNLFSKAPIAKEIRFWQTPFDGGRSLDFHLKWACVFAFSGTPNVRCCRVHLGPTQGLTYLCESRRSVGG